MLFPLYADIQFGLQCWVQEVLTAKILTLQSTVTVVTVGTVITVVTVVWIDIWNASLQRQFIV